MKKLITYTIASLIIAFATIYTAWSQSDDPALNKRLVEEKTFIFKAQTVSPFRGGVRQLNTNEYDVIVVGDSLIAFLPYFGRAFTAPINSEGGIKFTSTTSTYNIKRKKKRWEVEIQPGDVHDVQQLYFDVYDNGRATLRVTSFNRQPITFQGFIVERPSNKRAF